MMDLKLLVPAGAGLLLSFSTAADRVAFSPERGLSVTRTVENRMTLDLEDMTMSVDGQDMTAMMGGLPEMTMTNTMRVVVKDEYLELADGRPSKLKRTYDTISSNAVVDISMMGEGQSEETEMASDLEGGVVIFEWDGEAGEYRTRWEDEKETREAELLEGLEEDMDLRAFLPGREVSAGESWDIPIRALWALMMPGGNLHAEPEGMDDMDMDMDMSQIEDMFMGMLDEYEEMAEALLDGERKATYQGMREVDGRNLAVITLELDTDGTVDLSAMLADMMDRFGDIMEMPMEVDMSIAAADLSLTLEGTGELLWDPRRGTFSSMTMETDLSFGMEFSMDMDAGGGQMMTMDMTMEMAGDMESRFTLE